MDAMIYLSMAGAEQTLIEQSMNSQNLANISTPGFKADLMQARSMPVFGDGLATRVYAMTERPTIDFDSGPIMTTGRDLDVAVNGDGWIAVQAPDGTEVLSRAGDFRISANGLLTTGAGYPVLGNGGPIAIPAVQKIEIGSDGTISVRPLGQEANALAELDRIKLVNPPLEDLVKGEDGLIRVAGGGASQPDAGVGLVSGALEGSNVNPVEAMVNMITLARRFELQVKLMESAERNDLATSQMLRLT